MMRRPVQTVAAAAAPLAGVAHARTPRETLGEITAKALVDQRIEATVATEMMLCVLDILSDAQVFAMLEAANAGARNFIFHNLDGLNEAEACATQIMENG